MGKIVKQGGWKLPLIVVGVSLVVLVGLAVFAFSLPKGEGDKCIGVIRVDGPIFYDGLDSFAGGAVERIAAELNAAEKDERIGVILLEINSPGGSAAASKEVFDALNSTGKPVVSYFKDIAASGGYYIASASDFIVANPMAWTGSIGAIFSNFNIEGLMDEFGVRNDVFKSGEFKDIGSSFRNATGKEKLLLQELINESFKDFKADVIAARGAVGKSVDKNVFDARIVNARQALKFGLVDSIGNIQNARVKAAELGNFTFKGDESVCEFEKPLSLNSLFSGFASNLAKEFALTFKEGLKANGNLELR